MPTRGSSQQSKRHKPKSTDRLNIDELSNAPNLGGMLSMLDVSPEEALRRRRLRTEIEAARATSSTLATSPSDSLSPSPEVSEVVKVLEQPEPLPVANSPIANSRDTPASAEKTPIKTAVLENSTQTSSLDEQAKPATLANNTQALSQSKQRVLPASASDFAAQVFSAFTQQKASPAKLAPSSTLDSTQTNPSDGTDPSTPADAMSAATPHFDAEEFDAEFAAAEEEEDKSDDENFAAESSPVHVPDISGAGVPPHAVILPPEFVNSSTSFAPAPEAQPVTRTRPVKIRRASLVQHGHSSGEQLLYITMWNQGAPNKEGSRDIQAGYRRLSYLANMSDKAVKRNLHQLERKLAITTVAREDTPTRTGRTYRVFSYEQILARRTEAGMLWVKKTKGVEFLTDFERNDWERKKRESLEVRLTDTAPASSPSAGQAQALRSYSPAKTIPIRSTVPNAAIAPGDNKPAAAVDAPSPPLGSYVLGSDRNTSSVAPLVRELLAGLQKILPSVVVDNEAAFRLVNNCRAHADDCTVEEILHFVRAKAKLLSKQGITNPLGFLLTVIPKCFEGDSFRQFRNRVSVAAERATNLPSNSATSGDPSRNEQSQVRAQIEHEADRKARERLNALSPEELQILYNKHKADLLRDFPALQKLPKEMLDSNVRVGVLLEFREEELRALQKSGGSTFGATAGG